MVCNGLKTATMLDDIQSAISKKIAADVDRAVQSVFDRRGWPINQEYIQTHCTMIDRPTDNPERWVAEWFHDGQLFLRTTAFILPNSESNMRYGVNVEEYN